MKKTKKVEVEKVIEEVEECKHTNREIVDSKEVCKDCGKVL